MLAAKKNLPRQKRKAPGKRKTPEATEECSWQKKKLVTVREKLPRKEKIPRQKKNARGKKEKDHGKRKIVAAKESNSQLKDKKTRQKVTRKTFLETKF